MKKLKNLKSGILNATTVLSVNDYIDNIYLTNRQIWILQTWIGNMNEFGGALRSAVERGLDVKIAILNPKSDFLKYRSSDLQVTHSTSIKKIWSNLDKLEKLAIDNNFPDDFEVRLYDSTPTMGMYRLDDVLNLGFYWRKKNSTKGPNLVLQLKNAQNYFISRQALEHFDLVWNEAETLNFRKTNWREKYIY